MAWKGFSLPKAIRLDSLVVSISGFFALRARFCQVKSALFLVNSVLLSHRIRMSSFCLDFIFHSSFWCALYC